MLEGDAQKASNNVVSMLGSWRKERVSTRGKRCRVGEGWLGVPHALGNGRGLSAVSLGSPRWRKE